jgi:hypothetical protein
MKIVISGGTGFLGRPLAAALSGDGHDVVVLPRDQKSWPAHVNGAGAIVNLAGEPIAATRWTDEHKRRIVDSRVRATRTLADAVRTAASPPSVFISGSAVGYYGPLGDEMATEDTPAGSDFLANTCVQWEGEAQKAAGPATRVVCIRTGLVLEKDGGALPQMMTPFKFGVGGKLGSGRQYSPWIHREDWINLVRWTMQTPSTSGPVNATAPNPVTNAEFAHALGHAIHRPAFLPAPGFALKLILGEMAEGLLLSGQRAVPAKATHLGFHFKYKTLGAALQAIL